MKRLGWKEWIELPWTRVRAKMDTGARTSCMHATGIRVFRRGGRDWVRFQGPEGIVVEAPLLCHRNVRDSGGHLSRRPVVRALVGVAGESFEAEFTLADRSMMRCPVLLGRRALQGRFHVDPVRADLAACRAVPAA